MGGRFFDSELMRDDEAIFKGKGMKGNIEEGMNTGVSG